VKATRSSVRWPLRAIVPTLTVMVLVGGVASGCGGGVKKATSEPTTTTTTSTAPGAGQSASGEKLFSDNCESCHGTNGAGGHIGPNLQKSSVAENLAMVEKQVRNGGAVIPTFKSVLSCEEIDVVAHYVVEQIAPKG
jgi:mono/diheme cytochrome c family protein